MTENNTQSRKDFYIVTNADGEQFLHPKYADTFRILMDDKDTIRDVLNSVLDLDDYHEIIDLKYEFEKPIDIFMPEKNPSRLDVWVSTKDNQFINVEMQNCTHSFILDRMQLYNAFLTLRGKYEYNRSEAFKSLSEEERKYRYYEIPETVSIWFCNFPILKSESIFKDYWSFYSENDVMNSDSDKKAQPRFSKNRYIVVDLPKFIELRKGVVSREDFWLRLISQGPLKVPKSDDPIFSDAIERLRVSRVKQDFLKTMEAQMSDDIHVREAIEAEIWLKAEAKERSRNEAANAARDSQRAEYLRSQNIPDDVISAMLAIK